MVRLFRRRPRLPAERRPPLGRDERVIAWAPVAGGDGVVIVTNHGLWLPDRPDRLGWHDIHKAVWTGRELTVTPAEVAQEHDGYLVVADRPLASYPLLEPGDVPHQVRARVTRSVAYTSHHRIPGGGVRVVARRVSGIDGLTWTVRYDPGTAATDDAVVEETTRLVAAARGAADPDL